MEYGHTIHMVARPIEEPRTASQADASQAPSPDDGVGAPRILSGGLDLDAARLVSDALGFGRPPGFGVKHPVRVIICITILVNVAWHRSQGGRSSPHHLLGICRRSHPR